MTTRLWHCENGECSMHRWIVGPSEGKRNNCTSCGFPLLELYPDPNRDATVVASLFD